MPDFRVHFLFKPHNPESRGKLIVSRLQKSREPGWELSFLDFKVAVLFVLPVSS